MKLNGKSVLGIYIYSDNAEYDRGDFVVKGDCIYKCTASDPTDKENFRVTGKDPSLDHVNFKLYPGEMISTADEYFEYASQVSLNEQPEDKYISMHALYEILQGLYFGVSTNGVITKEVSDYSDIPEDGITNVDTDPLGTILCSKTLNNGVIKVSREIFNGVLGKVLEDNTEANNYWSIQKSDGSMVILRQYTYDYKVDNDTIRRRTQELVDPLTGIMLIRFLDSREEGVFDNQPVSTWRCVSVGPLEGNQGLRGKLDSIINGAINAGNNYNSAVINFEKTSLKSCYTAPANSKYVKGEDILVPSPESGINRIYTVVISVGRPEGEEYFQNYNFTFDSNELTEGVDRSYILDKRYLHLWISNQNGKIVVHTSGQTDSRGTKILNIFYKDDSK